MNRSLKVGSKVMGLIGSILALVVSVITYIIVAEEGNAIIAVLILIGGIIGGIVGIIGTAYIRIEKLLTPIMQLVAFALVLVGGIAMIVYCATPDPITGEISNNVLTALPFLFIPDLLIGTAGVFSLLALKEPKAE